MDWQEELFWCFIGSLMGTATSEAYGALRRRLKKKTSERRGKHFKRS